MNKPWLAGPALIDAAIKASDEAELRMLKHSQGRPATAFTDHDFDRHKEQRRTMVWLRNRKSVRKLHG